jgi:microcystin-dependent protein
MADPYLGEIRIGAFKFAPTYWAMCNGQSLPRDQNGMLFMLIGTRYGGDGVTAFNLPDLRGRVPIHRGTLHDNHYALGQAGGSENAKLDTSQLPNHTHPYVASQAAATSNTPGGNLEAVNETSDIYVKPARPVMMRSVSDPAGNGQPHPNMQPYLVVNFIISLYGRYPPQN